MEPAIETLRTALNSDPDKESALILLGLAYEADGRASFGEAQLAQAIDRNGLSPNLFQAYRGMLIRNGKAEDAADLTLRFAQTPDATRQVQRESAAVLIGQERFEEAETVARSLIRADGTDQDARRLLATTLLQQARNDEAIEALDQMSEESQSELASVQIRAEALARSERFDDLRTYLDAKIEDGQLPEAYILRSQVEASQGDLNRAASVARAGVEAFPQAENIYLALFNVHLAQAEMQAANAVLDQGIANAETTANLRVLRVNQYLQDGERTMARDMLISLAEDDQLNNLSANNLAALMLDLGDDPAEALEIAKRFEGTQQPFFADTLAWAYYQNGDLTKAEEYAAIAGETQA
ncbi:MAG: tetratricopeptide repeat protein, partial [Pseudomonadota bacterium]